MCLTGVAVVLGRHSRTVRLAHTLQPRPSVQPQMLGLEFGCAPYCGIQASKAENVQSIVSSGRKMPPKDKRVEVQVLIYPWYPTPNTISWAAAIVRSSENWADDNGASQIGSAIFFQFSRSRVEKGCDPRFCRAGLEENRSNIPCLGSLGCCSLSAGRLTVHHAKNRGLKQQEPP
jgi:hypothetical protein